MSKTIFISYHFNDKTFKGEIVKWLKEAGFRTISTDEDDYRPQGENAVRSKIREQIKESSHLLVLVGNDGHNRPWIDYEISVAGSLGIKRNWVRLGNRNGAPPREVRSINEIPYIKEEIIRRLLA
jgi:hypothetical protein